MAMPRIAQLRKELGKGAGESVDWRRFACVDELSADLRVSDEAHQKLLGEGEVLAPAEA